MLKPQIIQTWAPDNKRVVEAYFERKIATFYDSEDKNEQFKNLHKVLLKWAVLCGVKPLPNDDEMFLFVEYVAHHFYRFSLGEVDNAFNLATAGKLDVDPDHYQSFSVIYISKILGAYNDYKGKYILEYKKKLELSEKKEPTREERFVMMLDTILDSFENYKKNPSFNEFGYISYDFLSKLDIIHLDNETKAEIREISRKEIVEELRVKKKQYQAGTKEFIEVQNQINDILGDMTGKQDAVIRRCKSWALCKYYDFILENNLSLKSEIDKVITQ